MRKDRKERPEIILEKVEIIDAGAEGKAVAKVDNKVIFVPFVVPGDVVDLRILAKKKSFSEAKAVHFHHYSEKRMEPVCPHFGICGGCKWQNMQYQYQLQYKQKQVIDNLERIGKVDCSAMQPIQGAENIYYYRNKLEYTFSNRRWLQESDMADRENIENMNALGFHIPRFFDKVLNIEHCALQREPSNAIRLAVREYAFKNDLTFYDIKNHTGFLRNLIIRTSNIGELMVILAVAEDDTRETEKILSFLDKKFPEITSLQYVVNTKMNDTINDLPIIVFKGNDHIMEHMNPFREGAETLKFKISPKSFFQTNSEQAEKLYSFAAEFAELSPEKTVYDLYTGTGTIANYVSPYSAKVVGIEYVEDAIMDAEENSKINKQQNTVFHAGDMAKIFTDEFIASNGKPDIIITDPPRAGMHDKVIQQLLQVAAPKIVYVSCNPATQARDLALLSEKYKVGRIQAVDMFPHTQHVENVVEFNLI